MKKDNELEVVITEEEAKKVAEWLKSNSAFKVTDGKKKLRNLVKLYKILDEIDNYKKSCLLVRTDVALGIAIRQIQKYI